jgi:hypothetical protein
MDLEKEAQPQDWELEVGQMLTVCHSFCRIMPEVPQNMQNDLHRMELEARNSEPARGNNQGLFSPTNSQHLRNYSAEES